MRKWDLFFELYENLPRQGPGDNASTRKAYRMMRGLPDRPRVLDIGCGNGMQTLELGRISGGDVLALDNHQPFLDRLNRDARSAGLERSIRTVNRSMKAMRFEDGSFDIVWSEGALYQMGFLKGLKRCRRLLKPGGWLAVTEAVLFRTRLPAEVRRFWREEYPDITTVGENIRKIRAAGFTPVAHFRLPVRAWITPFYGPMEKRIRGLARKYRDDARALALLETWRKEIDIYRRHSDCFGYEFFIMRRE
ncbi:MAG: class I SAM-dependent methyltransferase [bacterium]|nr:class I SAM-dependent methyltransferase [bacterium]